MRPEESQDAHGNALESKDRKLQQYPREPAQRESEAKYALSRKPEGHAAARARDAMTFDLLPSDLGLAM